MPYLIPKNINSDRWFISTVIALNLFFSVSDAEACGICMAALVDSFLPPIWLWSLFSIVWFLSVSALATLYGQKISTVPSLGIAIICLIFLVLIGAAYIGPLGVLFLIPLQSGVFQKLFMERNKQPANPKFMRYLKMITIIGVVCFCGLILSSIIICKTRSISEFVLKWRSTYMGRSYMQILNKRGAEFLPDLRIIIEKGNTWSMILAAENIADFGQPDIDVPILIHALERSGYSPHIASSLRKLSGMNLPDSASSQMWLEEWRKKENSRIRN